MRLAESFYGQTSTRQKSGARGLCVYYKLHEEDGRLIGSLHEMDMDTLSARPDAGELRPLGAKHIHESDPESHWLPRLVIE